MINILPSSEPAIFAVEISGKLTIEQENEMLNKIEEMLKYHDKVSVLVVLGEDASWSIKAGLKDLKWILSNLTKLNKIAVVGDSKTIKWLVEADAVFAKMIGIGEKAFSSEELEQAWQWIEKKH